MSTYFQVIAILSLGLIYSANGLSEKSITDQNNSLFRTLEIYIAIIIDLLIVHRQQSFFSD